MLPSMPILFTRDSKDAFGNKIEPSTSFFNPNTVPKDVIITQVPIEKVEQTSPKEDQEIKPTTSDESVKKAPSKCTCNPLDTALVRSFYTKIQSRFATNAAQPINKFVQFQKALKTFDPSKETAIDLYRKIERIFGENHKDIVEEFLLFLTPGQAAQIGRFMDHFALEQMTNFIELLQLTLSRKPTVLRKVLRAITTGVNSGGTAEMKSRVLPHLRSSPRLTQMFKSLFPDERAPDSVYETGTDMINESFLTNDTGYDVWEFEEEDRCDSRKKLDAKESLDTVYLHGRVFLQHGRILRSACVTYPYSKEPYRSHVRRLAPNLCHLSPPESDEERSPKRNNKSTCKVPPKRTKKQLKSPTKNVKDVNDNTKHKDCIKPPTKTKTKTQSRTKNSKEKKEETQKNKRERPDSKSVNAKKEEAMKAKQAKIEAKESRSWTRDEDKTMLQVVKGEAGSEQMFNRIKEMLPHRSAIEIKERFRHVMNLLNQMVNEVT